MKLKLASDLHLPRDAATESFAILGRRGSGKTHTAVVMAEEMLTAGIQVVVIDPLDVWFGLRVSKDGRSAGFPIYVAGGAHADIPLPAESGRILADAVVDQRLDVVLSVRHLSKGDQRRFVADFCERLYDRKAEPAHRTALHVFIDEADSFVPQRLVPGSERCFGAVDTLVRRGRSSGLAPTLISQRPQVVNKDVLSQTEVLVSHQLTGPQDRKALEAWIEANDTEDRREEFMGSLASLPKGRAWFWSPGLLSIFKPVTVRDRKTFDSSITPKPGVVAAKPKAFAAVDLKKLTADIAATIEKAKADDPRELRRQIAALVSELDKARKSAPSPSASLKLSEADGKRVEKLTAAISDATSVMREDIALAGQRLSAALKKQYEATKVLSEEYVGQIVVAFAQSEKALQTVLEKASVQKVISKVSALSAGANTATRSTWNPTHVSNALVAQPAPSLSSDVKLNRLAERKVLQVLAVHGPRTKRQLAIQSGYAAGGGGFLGALSKLKTAGLIHSNGSGTLAITDAGAAAIGDVDPLPTGSGLVSYWLQQFNRLAEREVLRVLVEAYPSALTAADVASRTQPTYEPKGGGFLGAVSKLRTLGLIEGRGELRASEELF